ncbi:MAG: DUF3325 domain-containing protein [Caulobacter sp.]
MTAWAAFATLAIACAGFATLGLAMDRHRREMLDRELPGSFTLPLRMAGSAFLAVSLCVACLDAGSISMGIFWWLGLLGIAGMALGVLLAYRPRWARWLGVAAWAFVLAWAARAWF